MKQLSAALAIILLATLFSCKKTSFIDSPDALIRISEDTLHFDTVFTTTGSVTQSFKIFNLNDQKLRLSEVRLMGGASSPFALNLDGSPGTSFSNIEILPNDSVYAFVSVTINPNAANLPFIVRDSILISYNGNTEYLQLEAFGQNAHFLKGRRVTTDSTWTNDLPYVILDNITVDSNVTLTIQKGCRIYHHANAPFLVNGSLHVNGDSTDRVVFNGDRLDPVYSDLPGSWPGIFFNSSSTNNVLNYTSIKNGYQGIITEGSSAFTKVTLNQCIIDNIFDAGVLSTGSSIKATNCLVSNCGVNLYLEAGGNYSFTHCTVVSYGNVLLNHKNPVLYVSNRDTTGGTFQLNAKFTNCIFYGDDGSVEDEIQVDNAIVNATDVIFANTLFKNQTVPGNATFTGNVINNQPPEFEKIETGKLEFDFHLTAASPAVDSGQATAVDIDLDGRPRAIGAAPDLGCYELQ